MNTRRSFQASYIALLTAALLAIGTTTRSADKPTLKDAYKEHFMVGVAVNRTIAMRAAVRADNVSRTMEQVESDFALVREQFNQIVPENDTKWQLIHPHPGPDGYDFAPADAFVNFGLSNQMYLVGHTLVWHGQTPSWVFAGTNLPPSAPAANTNAPVARGFGRGGFTGPRASRDELLERMREHIHTVVGRYKGKIKVWDVVNEALSDGGTNTLRESSPWYQIIGPDFVAKAFQYAHEADSEAILRYNDYGLENPSKRRKLIALIKSLQEQKVPVHAIGSQTHINVGTTYETIDQALTDMKALGLPIHITELDVNSSQGGQRNTNADIANAGAASSGGLVSDADRRQSEAYAGLFRALLKHKSSVKVVTFWGANDAVSWLGRGRPLLFDGNNQPKPAFDSVIRVATEVKPTFN